MSISENVGAITQILSRLLSNPTSNKFLHDVDAIVSKIPSVGPSLSRKGHKIAESVKHLVSPGAFFEQYHLSYVGPVDGHDIESLISTFQGLKNTPYPVVVHLLTKKGNGMEEAENNPALWHGAKPFSKETCKFLPQASDKPTFPKVFGKAVMKRAQEDEDLVVVTPAMSQGSCLDEVMKRYPDRCIDVGIAEGHAVTFSAGIAWSRKGVASPSKKKRVIASIYSTFLQRAFDNVFHDVCIQEIPIVFAIDRAGIAGADGITHNGIYDIGFLNAMPNMAICQPRSGRLLRELLNSAFSWNRPTVIRYPNLATTDDETLPLKERPLGQGEILADGEEMAIFTLGHLAALGEEVMAELLQHGIRATLIDPIFVKPLDVKLLGTLAANHPYWVTIEEHALSSGFGSIVNNFVQVYGFNHIKTLNLGIPDLFLHHGSHKELSLELGLSKEAIVQKILLHFRAKAPHGVSV
jgi:1-deoxy-D-xylulose-5-phosphate synthase